MSLAESIILALSLSVDSIVVSTSSHIKSRMPLSKGLLMALIFAFFQGTFPLLGALIGESCQRFIASIDHWVAFILLAIVGIKMIWDAYHEGEKRNLDVTRFLVMCLLGIATSIDAFVIGVSFGLNSTMNQIIVTVIIIAIVTFLASMMGYVLGHKGIPLPEKISSLVAGLVLIALGSYNLYTHLV